MVTLKTPAEMKSRVAIDRRRGSPHIVAPGG
jgi:hypothetical protein